MQKILASAILILATSHPAHAGIYTLDGNGQLGWQSSRCGAAPAPPASLVNADRNSGAEDMNSKAQQYNIYVGLAQSYIDCVNTEAEQDAGVAGQSVVNAGQGIIDDMKKNLNTLATAAGKSPN